MSDATETTAQRSVRSNGAVAFDRRYTLYENVVAPVVGNISTATELDLRPYSGGTILLRNGETVVTLTFYVAEKPGGTYEQLYDTVASAVSLTVAADRAYPIPDECFGCNSLKIIGNAAATPDVNLKS